MRRLASFALGFSLGAGVGVAWVLLFAPQSGAELRQAARESLQEILEEARRAGAAREAEMAARFPITRSSPSSGM
jgi:gas vesicle protein